MALYRIYVDEVGNHDMAHADDPNQRFLSLTGVILESAFTLHVLQPEMDELKRRLFQRDPDVPVIFHRKEMVNKRPPFDALRDPATEADIKAALLASLGRWDYRVMTVVLDKTEHRDRYRVWHHQPYHYCLQVLLERFVLFLEHGAERGDVMVESRGGKEDERLKRSYRWLYEHGTAYVAADRWQARLTSRELKARPKRANVAGLQLADLIAHPSRREILLERELLRDDRQTFGHPSVAILRRSKYDRKRGTGQIEGFGKKLLPRKKKSALSGAFPMAYGHPPPLNGSPPLYHELNAYQGGNLIQPGAILPSRQALRTAARFQALIAEPSGDPP